MDLVLLEGPEHPQLATMAAEALPPDIAIALSAGGHPKRHPSVDANEDAVLAARDGQAFLLAVADGHYGFDAAGAAIGALRTAAGGLLEAAAHDPDDAVRRGLAISRDAIATALRATTGPRLDSRTALTVAAVGRRTAALATIGDTTAVVVDGRRATIVGGPSEFLGPSTPVERAVIDAVALGTGTSLILVSDGVSDYIGRDVAGHLGGMAATAPTPLALVRWIAEAAFAGGAGDNVAAAVWMNRSF